MNLFFMEEKLEKRIQEIKEYRYRDVRGIEEFLVKEGEGEIPNPAVPESFEDFTRQKVGAGKGSWDCLILETLEEGTTAALSQCCM